MFIEKVFEIYIKYPIQKRLCEFRTAVCFMHLQSVFLGQHALDL